MTIIIYEQIIQSDLFDDTSQKFTFYNYFYYDFFNCNIILLTINIYTFYFILILLQKKALL